MRANQDRFHCKSCPHSLLSSLSTLLSALCLKVPPVYRWLFEYRFEPRPPISPIPSADPTWLARVHTRARGSCLKSVFDVFLHTAQVRQASAARLVSEQSGLTHVDSSVHLTSQSREKIWMRGRGYTCTALCINTMEMCTRGVSICFC